MDITSLLIQFAGSGVVVAEKALSLLESMARKRNLYKDYPYLGEAFSNVKGFLGFLQYSFGQTKPKEVKKDERKKRTTGRKKVSKSKTLRHSR
jgi:hypothetical protein